MKFLTDFADQAVTLPLAVCLGVVLAASGWRRGAAAWLVAGGLCWSVMLLLKLGFAACGPDSDGVALADPSGHTASGTFVYAGMAALLLPSPSRWMAPIVALVVAGVVGASRVAIGAHSVPEVLAGGSVGLACIALLLRLAGDRPRALPLPPRWVWGGTLAMALMLHGGHLAAHAHIHQLGLWVFEAACAPS